MARHRPAPAGAESVVVLLPRRTLTRLALLTAAWAALLAAAARADTCVEAAATSVPPGPPAWVAQLQAGKHPFPHDWPLVSDWPHGQQCVKPAGWPAPQLPDTCKHESMTDNDERLPSVEAFKIFNRRLYVSSGSTVFDRGSPAFGMVRDPYALYRRTFIEALLIGLRVYKDVPDLEFAAAFMDNPRRCGLQMPVLQYNVFGRNRQADAGRVAEDEDEADTTCLPMAEPKPAEEREQCRQYNRGWVIPNPDTWQLAVSPDQLSKGYVQCVLRRSNATASLLDRRPVVFWRGSNTGASKGWSADAITRLQSATAPNGSACIAQVLLNKRIFMALQAVHYPWMDVRLSTLNGVPYCDTHPHLHHQLRMVTEGSREDPDTRARNLLLLVVDGWGPAYRLPMWLLSMTPVVHVESTLKQWLVPHFKPHVHYVPAASDLRDLPAITHRLVRQSQTPEGRKRLEAMAAAAKNVSVEVFNLLGQVDAIFAAAKAATQACGGSVRAPWAEKGWREVRVNPFKNDWLAPLFRHPSAAGLGRDLVWQFQASLLASVWELLLDLWDKVFGSGDRDRL